MRYALACIMVCGVTGQAICGVVDTRGHNEVHVDIPGGAIYGQAGDPLNTVIAVSGDGIHEYVQVSAIAWDFGLFMQNDWWFSQMRVRISNDSGDQYVFAPGADDDFGGINSYSSDGLISLVGSGDTFFVGADNTVYIEFFNPFDPNGGILDDLDAIILGGSMTIGTRVPAPGTLGLLSACMLLAARRSRC